MSKTKRKETHRTRWVRAGGSWWGWWRWMENDSNKSMLIKSVVSDIVLSQCAIAFVGQTIAKEVSGWKEKGGWREGIPVNCSNCCGGWILFALISFHFYSESPDPPQFHQRPSQKDKAQWLDWWRRNRRAGKDIKLAGISCGIGETFKYLQSHSIRKEFTFCHVVLWLSKSNSLIVTSLPLCLLY